MATGKLDAVATYLWLVEFALSAAFAITFTVSAVYFINTVGMNPLELVLVGTMMEATVFVFEVPTGVVADTYGRKRSVLTGWLVMGAGIVLAGAVHDVWAVLVGCAIWGLGWTFMSGAYQAWITDEVGAERIGPVFARGARLGYVGALVGVALSVVLAATFSTSFAVVTGGVVLAALAFADLAVMPETAWRKRPGGSRASFKELRTTAVEGGRLVRARPVLLLVLAITFFAGMSTESFDRLWQAHLLEDIGLPGLGSLDPVYWFGIFEACTLGIGFVLATLLVGRLEAVGTERLARMLLVVTAVQLGAALAFGLAVGLAFAVVGYLGYRATRSFAGPVYDTWLNQNIPDSSVRATVISITNQSDAIGQTAGGPALGAIGTVVSIRAALVSGALVLAPALALFARAVTHHGREPELEELAGAGLAERV
jgi:MFS transporter, DHA3 family, tetracycline resistance protein